MVLLSAAIQDSQGGGSLSLGNFTGTPALIIGASEDQITPFTDQQLLCKRTVTAWLKTHVQSMNQFSKFIDSGSVISNDSRVTNLGSK